MRPLLQRKALSEKASKLSQVAVVLNVAASVVALTGLQAMYSSLHARLD